MCGFFLWIRRTQRSTRTDTLCPYATLFRAREQRVILADADIAARIEFGAALAHDDVARNGDFAAELLHAETTACRIATVARRTACFFMCHRSEEHTSELQSLMRI